MATSRQWKNRTYTFEFIDPSLPIRTFRVRKPSNLIFEIQNYWELVKSMQTANVNFIETPEFIAGNEKWTMCIYPYGNGRQGKNYVSLYLRRQNNGLRQNKDASVSIKFFILEQLLGWYLIIEDMGERILDLRANDFGIAQALEINDFANKSNGFLVDNSCTFGAELFVTSSEPTYFQLALVKTISKRLFEIGIIIVDIQRDCLDLDSATFTTKLDGDTYTWKLRLILNGNAEGSNRDVSLYLILVDVDKLSNGRKMLVNFEFTLTNKSNGSSTYNMPAALEWYGSTKDSSGYPEFMKRAEFFDLLTEDDNSHTAEVKVKFNNIFILNE